MLDAGEDLELRPATVGDLGRVMVLERLCFPDAQGFDPRDHLHALTRPGAHLLVDPHPNREDAPRAFAGALWELLRGTPQAHVYTINVHPDHRGEGLGTRSLRELEERARAWGAHRVVLEVAVGNEAATRLYETAGYLRGERLEGYYTEARGEGDAWRYGKKLRG